MRNKKLDGWVDKTEAKFLIKALKAYAKSNKIAQEDIASQIGVRLGTVNRWFNDRNSNPLPLTRKAIEEFLNKNLEAENGQSKKDNRSLDV